MSSLRVRVSVYWYMRTSTSKLDKLLLCGPFFENPHYAVCDCNYHYKCNYHAEILIIRVGKDYIQDIILFSSHFKISAW